jgi:hypothetical protein
MRGLVDPKRRPRGERRLWPWSRSAMGCGRPVIGEIDVDATMRQEDSLCRTIINMIQEGHSSIVIAALRRRWHYLRLRGC